MKKLTWEQIQSDDRVKSAYKTGAYYVVLKDGYTYRGRNIIIQHSVKALNHILNQLEVA